jgi:hypothetical protein
MTDRDYAGELRNLIEKETKDGDIAAVVAARIVQHLRDTDPDLLDGWLQGHAVQLVTDVIGTIDRAGRAHVRAVAGRDDFAESVAAGDVQGFLHTRWVVDEADTRMRLTVMRAPQLRFVARGYRVVSRSAKLEAAFFAALAKKVGAGTVGEHFSEQQIQDLRLSIVGAVT